MTGPHDADSGDAPAAVRWRAAGEGAPRRFRTQLLVRGLLCIVTALAAYVAWRLFRYAFEVRNAAFLAVLLPNAAAILAALVWPVGNRSVPAAPHDAAGVSRTLAVIDAADAAAPDMQERAHADFQARILNSLTVRRSRIRWVRRALLAQLALSALWQLAAQFGAPNLASLRWYGVVTLVLVGVAWPLERLLAGELAARVRLASRDVEMGRLV